MVALVDRVEDIGDLGLDAFGRDAVLLVIGHLLFAAPGRLVHGALHGAGDRVGIEDDLAVDVARGAADRLDQRGFGAQEAFLVGIENGDEAAFGNIQALAQEVDADEHVESAEAQVADDLDALQRVDIRVHVAHAHALFVQVFGQVLGHALGQHGAEGAIAFGGRLADFAEHVVHLAAGGAHFHGRIDKAGRADDLFGEDSAGLFHFPAAGRGRHGDRIRAHRVPFLEAQRAVVHAGGQAEAVFGQRRLAPEVAAIHAADLRNGDMAFVDEDDGIIRHIFEQRRRRVAGVAAGEVARIVLDALAGAGGLQHFQVVAGALLQALGLQQAAGLFQLHEAALQLFADGFDRRVQRRARRHIVRIGVDLHRFQVAGLGAGQRVEFGDGVDLVAEHADAPGRVFQVGRENLDRVTAHAEGAAGEIHVAALVLLGHEIGQQLALVQPVADIHLEGHGRIGFDRADTVDAGDGGDDDAIVAFEQRARGRVAHAVDLLVDGAFLLDIGVGARHIGFRLVIIVVGNEIFHRIVGEEILEFGIELGGQRLVRREDQGRALGFLDHLGHGEGLARAGDAEQDLAALAALQPVHEIADRRRLVAGGLVFRGHANGDAAFGFIRPGRAVRRPDLAVLVQRVAALDQLRQRLDRGGDAAGGDLVGILQRDVEAGHGVEAGGSTRLRVGGTADGDAARRLADGRLPIHTHGRTALRAGLRGGRRTTGGGRLAAALRSCNLLGVFARLVLHLLAMLARPGGDFALAFDAGGLGIRLELPHPIGHRAGKGSGTFCRDSLILLVPLDGRPGKRRLGGFLETGRGGGFLRRSCHARNMAGVMPKWKGERVQKGNE